MAWGRRFGLCLTMAVLAVVARAAPGSTQSDPIEFNQVVESHPLPVGGPEQAIFIRAVIRDELGETDAAIADYSTVLHMVPSFGPALNNRANAYRRQGRYIEAVHDYRAALAAKTIRREYVEYGLGWIAQRQGRIRAARRHYGRALAVAAAFEPARQALSLLGSSREQHIVLHPPGQHENPAAIAVRAADDPVVPPKQTSEQIDLRPAIIGSPAPDRPYVGGEASIQLGAWRDEASAAYGWNEVLNRSGNLLYGFLPHIIAVDLPGKGRWYRLRTGPLSRAAARDLCAGLKRRGLACLIAGALPVAMARR